MGLFVCKKCNCVENTALGHWWSRKHIDMFEWPPELEQYKGEGLCSEHAPINFSDGSGKNGTGRWHGKFKQQSVDEFLKESGKYYKLRLDGYLEYINPANQE